MLTLSLALCLQGPASAGAAEPVGSAAEPGGSAAEPGGSAAEPDASTAEPGGSAAEPDASARMTPTAAPSNAPPQAAPQPQPTAQPEASAEPQRSAAAQRRRARFSAFTREGDPLARRAMIGISGVLMQAAPLRVRVVSLDSRDVGRAIALGGLGIFGRYRPKPIVGLDLEVRSGSVRYRRDDAEIGVSQDQFLAEAGAGLYLGRGDVAQFALSAGVGGMYTLVRYDADERTGSQAFGSAVFRVGAEAEFLLKRVAIVLSFRTYGVATPRGNTRSRGVLLEGASAAERRAPVATLATMLVGSLGLAYRF